MKKPGPNPNPGPGPDPNPGPKPSDTIKIDQKNNSEPQKKNSRSGCC